MVIGVAGYIEVAGRRTWHEVSGDGDPLVLLHGGFVGASSFYAQTPALVEAGYRVHVPERRGHAHTPDVVGPLSYSVMADDMVAYLEQEVGAPAHLVGWSDGAVVALLIARRRPDLVARMVLIGQYYNAAGKAAGGDLVAYLNSPEAITFLRRAYDPVSPDGPDHFAVVHDKMMHMITTEPEIALDTLADITAPTLVAPGRPGRGHHRTLRRSRRRAARGTPGGATRHARPPGRASGTGQPADSHFPPRHRCDPGLERLHRLNRPP